MTQKRTPLNDLFPELSPNNNHHPIPINHEYISSSNDYSTPPKKKKHEEHSNSNNGNFDSNHEAADDIFMVENNDHHNHHHHHHHQQQQQQNIEPSSFDSLVSNSSLTSQNSSLGDTTNNILTNTNTTTIDHNNHHKVTFNQQQQQQQDEMEISSSLSTTTITTRLEKFVHENHSAQKALKTIQQCFLRKVVRKNLKKLSTMCKKRKHVINEIISTEKSYVADLKTIMDVFYTPIVKKGIEASENMASIFVNVEMIYNLNEKLYQRLVIAQDHQDKCEQKQNEMIKQLISSLMRGSNAALLNTSSVSINITNTASTNTNTTTTFGSVGNSYTDAAEFRMAMSSTPIGAGLDRRATITSPTEHQQHSGSSTNLFANSTTNTPISITPTTTTSTATNTIDTTSTGGKSKKSKKKKENKKKSGGTMKTLKDLITRTKLPLLDIPNNNNGDGVQNSSRSTTSGGSGGSFTPTTGQIKSFGGAFAEMAPFMRLYTDYINNFSQASSILKERRKKNQQLQNYLNKCKETREECRGLDVSSFLILPVQRIPKYQLLLRELLKYTPKGHSDYMYLSTAHDTMIQVANHLNEMRRQKLAFTRVMDIKQRLTELSFQLVTAMKNSLVENPIVKHNFNSIEQVKNSIIKPHRHFVNEVLVNVIRDKVSPLKLQWIDKAINTDMPQSEPIPFESYLFNDYFLLIIKGIKNEDKTDDPAMMTLPSASLQTMATDRSNYTIFARTPRDTVVDINQMDEILGQKELTAPFIVQPFYLSISDFTIAQNDPLAMKCKDYISGAEFTVFFETEELRNEWYNNISDKKKQEIQKLIKQMTEKHTKAKFSNLPEYHGSETARARDVEETELHARNLSIEKFGNISEFIREKISIQNRFIKMRMDFDKIKKTFDKDYEKYQTLKMILSRLKDTPDLYEKKQKQVIEYENEMVKTKTRLKDASERLQKGESVFNQMIERTKECDEVILMCLRNDIESLTAFFGDSQILDQPEIVDLREIVMKMQSIDNDIFYLEIEHKFPKPSAQPLSVSSNNIIINSSFHKMIPSSAESSMDDDTSSETGSTMSNAQTIEDEEDLMNTPSKSNSTLRPSNVPKLQISVESEVPTDSPSAHQHQQLQQQEDNQSQVYLKKIEELDLLIKSLQEDRDEWKIKFDTISKELDSEKQSVKVLSEENSTLKADNSSLTTRVEILVDDIEQLRAQQSKKQDELSNINKRRSNSVPIKYLLGDSASAALDSDDEGEDGEKVTSPHSSGSNGGGDTFIAQIPTVNQIVEQYEKQILEVKTENEKLIEEIQQTKNVLEQLKTEHAEEKQSFTHQIQILKTTIENMANNGFIPYVDSDFETDEESSQSPISTQSEKSSSSSAVPRLDTSIKLNKQSSNATGSGSGGGLTTQRSRIQEHVEKYEQLSRSNLGSSRIGKNKSKFGHDSMLDDSETQSIDNKILKITIQTVQYQLQTERQQHELTKKAQSSLKDEINILKKKLEEANKAIEDMKKIVFTHFKV